MSLLGWRQLRWPLIVCLISGVLASIVYRPDGIACILLRPQSQITPPMQHWGPQEVDHIFLLLNFANL